MHHHRPMSVLTTFLSDMIYARSSKEASSWPSFFGRAVLCCVVAHGGGVVGEGDLK